MTYNDLYILTQNGREYPLSVSSAIVILSPTTAEKEYELVPEGEYPVI